MQVNYTTINVKEYVERGDNVIATMATGTGNMGLLNARDSWNISEFKSGTRTMGGWTFPKDPCIQS